MRELAGVLIVFVVLAVAPAIMLSSPIWWVVAVALVIGGLVLLYSGRRVVDTGSRGAGRAADGD